jgi:hypothetical protein
MRLVNTIGAAALALAVSACAGKDSSNPDLENVPDESSLTLEVQGGDAEGITQLGLTDARADEAATVPATYPNTGDDLAAAREKIAAVNEAIRTFLANIEAVALENGVPAAGQATVYGPVDRCIVTSACDAGGTASLKLTIARAIGSIWAFALEAAPVGTSEFKPVAAGWLRRAPVIRRGSGRIAFNLENLRLAAPAYTGQGYLLGGFSSGPAVKRLTYVLTGPNGSGFTPDPARWPATNAAFRGYKTAAGTSRVRVASLEDLYADDVSDTGTELGFGHVIYNAALGGRAYALVTNYNLNGTIHGDVPTAGTTDSYFLGRSCYLPGQTTPAFKEWFHCARSTRPTVCILETGGVGTKVVGAEGASWQNTCQRASEPTEADVPDSAPATTASDTSSEQGENEAGTASETPPTDPTDVVPPSA